RHLLDDDKDQPGSNPGDDARTAEAAPVEHQAINVPVDFSLQKHAATNVEVLSEAIHARIEALKQMGHVELHLDLSPPDLGRVRIQLVAHDQEVNVRLVVQNEAAQHAIIAQVE